MGLLIARPTVGDPFHFNEIGPTNLHEIRVAVYVLTVVGIHQGKSENGALPLAS